MLYVRFPLSIRNVQDLLHERGIDVSHEVVRFWWHRLSAQCANNCSVRFRVYAAPTDEIWHCEHLRKDETLPALAVFFE